MSIYFIGFLLSPDTHTHTTVLLLCWNLSGTTRVSRYQKGKTGKGKTNLDLLEQEIVSGSGICWAICKSAPHPRQPRQHPTRDVNNMMMNPFVYAETVWTCNLLQPPNVQWVYVITYITVFSCRRECHPHHHRRSPWTGLSAGMSMPSCCLVLLSIALSHCLSGPFSRLPTLSCSCLAVPTLDESFAVRYIWLVFLWKAVVYILAANDCIMQGVGARSDICYPMKCKVPSLLWHCWSEMESSRPWPWPRGSSRPADGVLGLGLGLGCHVLGLGLGLAK